MKTNYFDIFSINLDAFVSVGINNSQIAVIHKIHNKENLIADI